MNKKIYITMGDPRGIGPQIILKSLKELVLSETPLQFIPVIIGDHSIMNEYCAKYGVQVLDLNKTADPQAGNIYSLFMAGTGHPGRDSLAYIDTAVGLCLENAMDAVVTGPVIKEAVADIKSGFMGHTEYIAALAGISKTAMTFIAGRIKMSLITTHIPLSSISKILSPEMVTDHVLTVKEGLRKFFNISSPGIVMC
ncbi:4-hydroxythreonine-4-phosphate dehydrogenase PdxA, partial [Elusimicrobiota bacterium]